MTSMNLKIRTVQCTVLLGFVLLFPATSNSYSSPEFEQRIMSLGNAYIQSIIYPIEGESPSFKQLTIGQEVDLSDTKLYYIKERSGSFAPWMCHGSLDNYIWVPLVACTLGNVSKFPAQLSDLKLAFGENVSTELLYILQKMPTRYEVQHGLLGRARLAEIRISTKNASDDMAENAINYFRNFYNSEPEFSQNFQSAGEIYSPQCKSHLAKIKAKRAVDITLNDRNTSKACEAQASLAFLNGKLNSVRQRSSSWFSSKKTSFVLVLETSTVVTIPGTGIAKRTNEVTIQIALPDNSSQINSSQKIEQLVLLRKEIVDAELAQKKVDF